MRFASAEVGTGILGGTFDPVHDGHIALAARVRDALHLEAVRLMPNSIPPHRPQPLATAQHRLAMLRLAVHGRPGLVVDDRELRRTGPSWTVDTLEELRRELGPQARLVLILGADAFAELGSWSRWLRVFSLAQIAVVGRPGSAVRPLPGMPSDVRWSESPGPIEAPACAVTVLAEEVSPYSASALRETLLSNPGVHPPGLCEPVHHYIQAHSLYGGRPQ